jgi:formylglycine-generating enzyme required for sulfatase activity
LVSAYIKNVIMLFLDGNQPQLSKSKDYLDFVTNFCCDKELVCKKISDEVEEVAQYDYPVVTRFRDRIEVDLEQSKFKMIKVYKEENQHFFIGETAVTDCLWNLLPSSIVHGASPKLMFPITEISINEVQEFMSKLSHITGLSFRLPSAEEWKWAAKGGNKSKDYQFIGGNNVDEVAWWRGNSDNIKHPVAMKKPNELGLYDMGGNIWEMTSDTILEKEYLLIPDSKVLNKYEIDCGGSYLDNSNHCTPSFTGKFPLKTKDKILGFRLACD